MVDIMSNHLYKIARNPISNTLVALEYEIMYKDAGHYYISPRNTPNKDAEKYQDKIKKSLVRDPELPILKRDDSYFRTKEAAVQGYINRRLLLIQRANDAISEGLREIEECRTELWRVL
jgi:hypothetical protein